MFIGPWPPIEYLNVEFLREKAEVLDHQRSGRKPQWNHNRERYHDRWSVPSLLENRTAPNDRAKIRENRRHIGCDIKPGRVGFVDAAVQNYLENGFYKLPDNVILSIMKLLDAVSLECLRRTGRLFLQLFEKCDFLPAGYKVMDFPWARSSQSLTPQQRITLASLLRRDSYCTDCHAAKLATNWGQRVHDLTQVYLHCSGCQLDHPVCLFLPSERSKGRDSRLCIGHTGYIRLCSHAVFRWSDVQRVPSRATFSWQRLKGTEVNDETVVMCRHKDHMQPCQQQPRGWSFPILFSRKSWQEATFPLHPRVSIRKTQVWWNNDMSETQKKLTLYISWMAHVDLGHNDQSLTPDMLDEHLSNLREQQAGFTCPEAEPGRLIEKMLFDPNRCDCLRYTQLDRLGGTWHRAQTPLQTAFLPLTRTCLFGKYRQRLGPLIKAQAQQPRTSYHQRTPCKDFAKQAHALSMNVLERSVQSTYPALMDRTIALPW
ncbi:hypothetical protein QBC41DRAFT_212530 [Cercophora samala]|uniref:F-box domain-containing protein n=1 Tax=Cercophora samala TaxID=330535 RepID=A0AA39ZNQ1_9PEZI|nr:hypothetical protein QBC41DRAFT_212530 [Cercophora samala]